MNLPFSKQPEALKLINRIYFILFASLLCMIDLGLAQDRVTILESERLSGFTENGKKVRKLVGNVRLRSGNKTIRSDSAYHYDTDGILKGFGNILITTPTETVWADSIRMDLRSDISNLFGTILIRNDSAEIATTRCNFAFATNVMYLPQKFILQDQAGNLTADYGIYFSDLDSAAVFGNVQVLDSTVYLEADSLFSRRVNDTFVVKGNVYIENSKERTLTSASFVRSDSTAYKKLEGHAHLVQFDSTRTDTSHILAQVIEEFRTDSTSIIKAQKEVKIKNKDISSISSFAIFDEENESIELSENVKAWHKKMQITAQTITFDVKNDTLRSLKAWFRPFIVQEDSATSRLHQMVGDSLFATFKAGDIHRVNLHPTSILYYFLEDDGKPDGMIDVMSQKITLFFNNGSLEEFKASQDIRSNFYEESEDLAQKRLEGFDWSPEARPKKLPLPTPRKSKQLPTIETFFKQLPKLYYPRDPINN